MAKALESTLDGPHVDGAVLDGGDARAVALRGGREVATAGQKRRQRHTELAELVERELRPRLLGPCELPGTEAFEAELYGYRPVPGLPSVAVGAVGVADVMAAVAFATTYGLPVGVQATGHGSVTPVDGALMVSTRRMRGVRVDPFRRTAYVEAGVQWQRVIHEAAAFGLAPLSGSSTTVGAVGYTLGGGLPLLGRTFGYAADHVRALDVVTVHGALRQVRPDQYRDLFWALRGGKGNFGVVTAMEIDLMPVPRIYGGGLYFRHSAAAAVFHAYRRWVRTAPEAMNSSIAIVRYPWTAHLPEFLRGRTLVHLRIAYHGTPAEGEELVRPLRQAAVAVRDTVTDLPYTASHRVHDDPDGPQRLLERGGMLRAIDEDAVDALLDAAGPDSNCPLRLVELRHLGGALGRQPVHANAIGGREAQFQLYMAGSVDDHRGDEIDDSAGHILQRLAPWHEGGPGPNFLGAADLSPHAVQACYGPANHRRLVTVKRQYDPENLFRVTHAIAPTPGRDD